MDARFAVKTAEGTLQHFLCYGMRCKEPATHTYESFTAARKAGWYIPATIEIDASRFVLCPTCKLYMPGAV